MTINFIPGEVNGSNQSVIQSKWKDHTIVGYCSGNNLIILSNDLTNLQTIYLEHDAYALSLSAITGKFAVGIKNKVVIYKPLNEFMKKPKWIFDIEITNPNDHSTVNSVHWNQLGEIIVGSEKSLTLWNIYDEYGETKYLQRWFMFQPNPVYLALFTKNGSKIATMSKYDKLIKIWTRSSFNDESAFDLVYLNHPAYVTSLRWRFNEFDESIPDTLYTIAADGVLRIWSSYEFDGAHNVQHWGSLDLYDDQLKVDTSKRRFANIIDNFFLREGLKQSLIDIGGESKVVNHEVLRILKSRMELVIVTNEFGQATLYSLENVSVQPPKLIKIEKIAKRQFNENIFPRLPRILSFAHPMLTADNKISLIIHDFVKGNLRHSLLSFADLLLKGDDARLGTLLEHKYTGHSKSIRNLIRTSDGSAVLSTSRFGENYIWKPIYLTKGVTMEKKCFLLTPSPIIKAVLFQKGNYVVTLVEGKLLLWDSRSREANLVAEYENTSKEEPLILCILPGGDRLIRHVVAVYSQMNVKAWEVDLAKCQVDQLSDLKEIHLISTVDPVGWNLSLDPSQRDVLSIIDSKGLLSVYGAKIEANKIKWVNRCSLETGIANASYIRGSSVSKIAIVHSNASTMYIWDSKRMVLEYEEEFSDGTKIRDLDWTCTDAHRSILAVGFNHYVSLYTQLRYDYTNDTPSFTAIKKIDISDYTTHTIGDSIWLKDGTLVIAAGNQFYVSDKELDLINDEFTIKSLGSRIITSNDIFELTSILNGPLPLYHPQFIIQCLFLNKVSLVKEILVKLFGFLRKLDLDPSFTMKNLESNLGIDPDHIIQPTLEEPSSVPSSAPMSRNSRSSTPSTHKLFEEDESSNDVFTNFNQQLCELLIRKLVNVELPYLTRHQQMTLVTVVNIVSQIDKYCKSLDENGIRFFIGLKLFQSNSKQEKLTMRDINWALHSDNKEIILDIIEESNGYNILWKDASNYGLSYWLNTSILTETLEKIARNEFNKDDARDPSNCAIFYLALKKKQILIGLWKNSVGHGEQQKMLTFLKNDFKQKRWKTAALKNAFVLLSKHRFMDAACFFLLGDCVKDCVSVLAKQVNDISLAIAVARVYEGDDGPTLKYIIESFILTDCISRGDRWTNSWIYWKLDLKQKAIQALVKPPIELVDSLGDKKYKLLTASKLFVEDDPVLIILFQNLRERNLNYFKGSLLISPKEEFNFILRVSMIYSQMGCEYLSLNLVKNWNFIKYDENKNKISWGLGYETNGLVKEHGELNLPAKARNFSIVATNKNINVQPPPTVAFEEPDMSSFDFGF